MDKKTILGVKVDTISMSQAVEIVINWVKKGGRHYIVTPNIEFLIEAEKDLNFKKILNQADLAIADSARLNWVATVESAKSLVKKIWIWPFFIFPNSKQLIQFDTITGTDLMYRLLRTSSEYGFRVGFLGGNSQLAEQLSKCLKEKYPKLKVSFISHNIIVKKNGEVLGEKVIIPETDILFVGLGQVKQENWIYQNLEKYPVKVMIGVGGAIDYLAGVSKRAPISWRDLGLEWLYRLINQPWRMGRISRIVVFTLLLPFKTSK